jgi:hypothetical protein
VERPVAVTAISTIVFYTGRTQSESGQRDLSMIAPARCAAPDLPRVVPTWNAFVVHHGTLKFCAPGCYGPWPRARDAIAARRFASRVVLVRSGEQFQFEVKILPGRDWDKTAWHADRPTTSVHRGRVLTGQAGLEAVERLVGITRVDSLRPSHDYRATCPRRYLSEVPTHRPELDCK